MSQSAFHIKQIDYTIDLLGVHQLNPETYPFLFESVAKNDSIGRYDILFAHPQASLYLDGDNSLHMEGVELNQKTLTSAFEEWYQQEKSDEKNDLPFQGGWFVFFAYEFAEQIESVLNLPKDTSNLLPLAYFCRIPAAIIIDHQSKKNFIVAENEYSHLLKNIEQDIYITSNSEQDAKEAAAIREEVPEKYIDGIAKIKKYIIDGDVFQVNLSREWTAKLASDTKPYALYQKLRSVNPAPFAGLALIKHTAIISSSPERLVKVQNNLVETRPIAGTRPRIRNAQGELDDVQNQSLQDELISHPKERAEHVMLIDLERNDLGRVCMPGSVEVNELMVLESYQHVHHIVSNVRGKLKEECTPLDVIKAVFPGGTITGCPKVRCMEIIAELEQKPRMAYTGSMGYINRNGDMDLNILIRSIIQHDKQLIIRAGAGIVADSDPDKELQETRHKAKGMLNAL